MRYGHAISSLIPRSLTGAVVIIIVCLATASPNFQSGDFVFRTYINESGWNDGVAWILGLLQSSFGLTGYDAVSHMVEEMPNPHVNAPRVMILAVCIGAASSFVFLICLLFSIQNVDLVNTSAAGALLESMYQATGSKAGAICLQVFPIAAMAFTAQALMCASSRMSYSFARDHGLPFSRFFSIMHKNGVPIPAVLLNTVCVVIFGCIYLGSSTALNAILSSSVVFLNVSYSIPSEQSSLCAPKGVVTHVSCPGPDPWPKSPLPRGIVQARLDAWPHPRTYRQCCKWTMGFQLQGTPADTQVGIVFTIFTTVFFLFPPDLPVSGSNMNYAVVVFGIISESRPC
jgi:choline transport protein